MKGTIRLSGVLLLNRSTWRTFVLFQHGWYVSLIEGLADIKNKVLSSFYCDEMFGKITSPYAHVVKRSIFYTSQITLEIPNSRHVCVLWSAVAPPTLPFRVPGSLIYHLRGPMKTALQLSVPVSIHQLRDSVRTYGILLRFAGWKNELSY